MNNQDYSSGLSTITISKQELLKTLRENLEAHNEVYNASVQAYYEALRAEYEQKAGIATGIEAMLRQAVENVTKDPDKLQSDLATEIASLRATKVSKPVSHEEDYSTVIRKIEMSVHDKFALCDSEFNAYILNKWNWTGAFIANANSYTNMVTGAVSGMLASGVAKFNK